MTAAVPGSAAAVPRTELTVREDRQRGAAVLSFSAAQAPGGAPIAFTEYRVDKGRWRRGESVEVQRRRIFSRVQYRSVDAAGRLEPVQAWEKNWPGLRTVAWPAGTRHWTATYDWYRLGDERWWLDHPVCLIFCAEPPAHVGRRRPAGAGGGGTERAAITVAAVEEALRALGFRSRVYDLVRGLDLASDGGLALGVAGSGPGEPALGVAGSGSGAPPRGPGTLAPSPGRSGGGEPPDPFVPTSFTQGVKLRLDPGNFQSSAHVRVYAPPSGSFHDPRYGAWLLGTCHLDVNELMRVRDDGGLRWGATLPRGAPDPGLDAELIKYGGNSEWVERLVADLWEREYGAGCVARGAVEMGDPQDWFQVARRGTHQGKKWTIGKWWVSDGRATVLTLPSR